MLCPHCRGKKCAACLNLGVVPSPEQRRLHTQIEEVKKLYSYVPHRWTTRPANNWEYCGVCGVVKREDGKPPSSCKGPHKLGLRKA